MGRVAIGVDIGTRIDNSAIVVSETVERERTVPGGSFTMQQRGLLPNTYQSDRRVIESAPRTIVEEHYLIRAIKRLELGLSYPAIVSTVTDTVINTLALAQTEPDVLVDQTGVGGPVMDLLHDALDSVPCRLIGVTLTATDRVDKGHRGGRHEWRVGKPYLASRTQSLMQSGRLRLPGDEAYVSSLRAELLAFEVRARATTDEFGARSGSHDDQVVALALSVLGEGGGASIRVMETRTEPWWRSGATDSAVSAYWRERGWQT